MKKILFFAFLLFLLGGNAQAQNEVFCYSLGNGDTLWYQCHYAQNENDSNYAIISSPDPGGGGYDLPSNHQKPSGHLSIPESLPQPWWWCDTTGWENYPGGFDQAWIDLAPRIPVVKIRYGAFSRCQDILSVIIPNTVKIIDFSFPYCIGLTNVTIPSSVKTIHSSFVSCTGLTSVTIGESVEELSDAFRGCTHLTTIRCHAEYPPICDEGTFRDVPSYADIIVPCGAAYRYQLSDYWMDFSRITEDCDGIDDAEVDGIRVWTENGQIKVEGSDGLILHVFDMEGRQIANNNIPSGVYLVKIGSYPARKVVVVR
jgi:hypothetical protein